MTQPPMPALTRIDPDALAALVEEELIQRTRRLLQACAPRLTGTLVDMPHPRSRVFGETHRTVVGQQLADLATYAKEGLRPGMFADSVREWKMAFWGPGTLFIRPLLDALTELVADFGGASALLASDADLDQAPPLDPVPCIGSDEHLRPLLLRYAGRELAVVFAAARCRAAIEQGWDPPARWIAALGNTTTARVHHLWHVGEIEASSMHQRASLNVPFVGRSASQAPKDIEVRASNEGARRWLVNQGVRGLDRSATPQPT